MGGESERTFGLVEGQEDDGAVRVEVRVLEEREEPEVEPVANEVDRRVVSVIHEVRRDEAPLRDVIRLHVVREVVN